MPEHSDEPLPGLQFLGAQRLGQVGDDQQVMRQAALAEGAAADAPAPAPPGKLRATVRVSSPSRNSAEPQLFGAVVEELVGGLVEQLLAGAIDQAQDVAVVEGEDRDVDLLHDRAQQRRGLDRAQALSAQRGAHGVHLLHHFAERVVGARAAGPDRVVALAHGFEQVGEGAQRRGGALANGGGEGEPAADDEYPDGPLGLAGVVADVEQDQR